MSEDEVENPIKWSEDFNTYGIEEWADISAQETATDAPIRKQSSFSEKHYNY
jgi:hypothetical protein